MHKLHTDKNVVTCDIDLCDLLVFFLLFLMMRVTWSRFLFRLSMTAWKWLVLDCYSLTILVSQSNSLYFHSFTISLVLYICLDKERPVKEDLWLLQLQTFSSWPRGCGILTGGPCSVLCSYRTDRDGAAYQLNQSRH